MVIKMKYNNLYISEGNCRLVVADCEEGMLFSSEVGRYKISIRTKVVKSNDLYPFGGKFLFYFGDEITIGKDLPTWGQRPFFEEYFGKTVEELTEEWTALLRGYESIKEDMIAYWIERDGKSSQNLMNAGVIF